MYCVSAKEESQRLCESLEEFVALLSQWLDERLDERLARTFVLTLRAILPFRHTKYPLPLSGLGA
jgi:hypothetical protein